MSCDVYCWIDSCDRCVKSKKAADKTELVSVSTYQSLELVCLDYITLEPSKGGIQDILVLTYHFTKFSVAVFTKHQTAKSTNEAIFNNFNLHYKVPTITSSGID